MTVGAVDIGASKVLVGLADDGGRLLPAVHRFDTPAQPDQLVRRVAESLAELGAGDAARTVGCVVPGPLDPEQTTAVSFHNRHWSNVPLRDLLVDAIGVPVLLEDDATAAALGEALAGAGEGCDPVAYLTVSSGVGAGLVVAGRPLRGAHGLAGEIGHVVIDPAGPPCGCGRSGDIEAYAGGLCMARRARELRALPEDAECTTQALFDAAAAGRPAAARIIAEAQTAVAHALAILLAAFDPERVVVGGGIALAQPEWVAGAVLQARERCLVHTGNVADVAPAALGGRSGLAGAAVLAARAASDGTMR